MKTSELINRLMESVVKFGDQDVISEMQVMDKGVPLLGRRVPLVIETTSTSTKLWFQFHAAPPAPKTTFANGDTPMPC